jgi:hypothetical protein
MFTIKMRKICKKSALTLAAGILEFLFGKLRYPYSMAARFHAGTNGVRPLRPTDFSTLTEAAGSWDSKANMTQPRAPKLCTYTFIPRGALSANIILLCTHGGCFYCRSNFSKIKIKGLLYKVDKGNNLLLENRRAVLDAIFFYLLCKLVFKKFICC